MSDEASELHRIIRASVRDMLDAYRIQAQAGLVRVEAVAVASFAMMEAYGVITIPVTGMPGAACVLRLMMFPDGPRLGEGALLAAARHGLDRLVEVLADPARARRMIVSMA